MSMRNFNAETGEVNFYIRRPMWRERLQTVIEGESRTHQAHADSCDVNVIIARYERTGALPPAKPGAQYGDVTLLQGDLGELAARSAEVISTANAEIPNIVNRRRKEKQAEFDLSAKAAQPTADTKQE